MIKLKIYLNRKIFGPERREGVRNGFFSGKAKEALEPPGRLEFVLGERGNHVAIKQNF